jgi:hypothetical protein
VSPRTSFVHSPVFYIERLVLARNDGMGCFSLAACSFVKMVGGLAQHPLTQVAVHMFICLPCRVQMDVVLALSDLCDELGGRYCTRLFSRMTARQGALAWLLPRTTPHHPRLFHRHLDPGWGAGGVSNPVCFF